MIRKGECTKMNILSPENDSMTREIFSMLKHMNLETPWMQKAEKFFDLSKEIDLSLLEGKPQNPVTLWSSAVMTESKNIIAKLLKDSDYSLSDRYILFIDAIGVAETVLFNRSDFHFSFDIDEKNHFYHAFSLVYKNDYQIKAKIYAESLVKTSYYYGIGYNLCSMAEIAEKDPRFLYEAGKFNSPERLFTIALAFAETKNGCAFSKEELSEMTKYIFQIAKNVGTAVNYDYQFFISILYMAKNYSKDVMDLMMKNISGREEDFLQGIVKNVPKKYFVDNIDSLFEIMGKFIGLDKIIKASVLAAYEMNLFKNEENSAPKTENAEILLSYEAKKFPEQYFAVLTSKDPMSGINRMGYVPDYYYIYYELLFDILEKSNPEAAKRLSNDKYKDMAELFIQTEEENSKCAQEEIGQYLRGEKDISVLLPKHDIIANTDGLVKFTDYHTLYIIYSLRHLPKYRDRYISFKTIQDSSNVFSYASSIIRSMHFEKPQAENTFKSFVQSLINEKTPIEDRFKLYQCINNDCFYGEDPERDKIFDIFVEKMLSMSDTLDGDYEQLAAMKNIYAKKLYARYLARTDIKKGNHKNILIAMCGDSSKEVRREVISAVSEHKELENDVKELLNAKKQAYRETAVEILNLWGAENYQDILANAAKNEKNIKISDRISEILNKPAQTSSSDDSQTTSVFSAENYIKNIHKGGRIKKIQWLYDSPMPAVHKKDGSLADDAYMQAIILSYMPFSSPKRSFDADKLAEELDRKELEAFALEVYSRWFSAGADTKKKQAMYFSAAYGGNNLVDEMLKCVKNWAENLRGAIASETVKAIALNGSSQALMAVDNIARKFKHKQVRSAAAEAISNAAKILGITSEELGDRIVPDLGFDSERKRVFDYGTRKFIVYLSPELSLDITDENGKKIKTMPSPGKRDDEQTAKNSYDEFKQLKKQLKNVVSIQSSRLEAALISDRRWKKSDWEKLFVNNPVMHSFAEGLIWAAYVDDKTVETFRYMDDGTFNNADSDEYELPDNCTIGLVHPLELDEDTLSNWKEQLSDYEITQPILQLERPVFRASEDEKGKLDVTRFHGRKLSAFTLVGRTEKAGWYKGSIQDGGGFFEFYREDVTSKTTLPDGTEQLSGCAAEFSFSGCSVGYYEEEIEMENLRFYNPGTIERGSYVYDKADDKKAIPLDKVNPRYFSEIVYQLEQITKIN